MKCVRCGTDLNENDKYCLGCGFEVGSVYEKPESAETLESLMELPVNESFDGAKDDVEELQVDDVIEYNETIDGSVVSVNTSNVSEGEVLKPAKKKKKYRLIIIILALFLVCLGLYILIDTIINNTGNNTGTTDTPKDVVKPNINNHPTSLYSFGNRFIIKLSNLWTLLDKNINDGYVEESNYFIIDGATLTMNLYNYGDDPLNEYIKRNEIDTDYEEVKINDEKYYLFTFDNNKNYVKIVDDYLYAFEFFYSENIDNLISDIMNNVIYYK